MSDLQQPRSNNDMARRRVIIADDHYMVRQGLAFVLKAFKEFDLVGIAENGAEAVTLCREKNPDVVLMDIMMPVMNGFEATSIITEQFPDIEVIMLSGLDASEDLVNQARLAGASYIFQKHESMLHMMKTIRLVIDTI